MHQKTENRPIGGIDSDSENRLIEPTDYRYALNIRNSIGYSGQFAVLTNVKGNVLVDNYTLPSGINKCIGSYYDKGVNTTIYFVWNSNGEHTILRFYPNKTSNAYPYGTIQEVIKFNFGWSDDEYITSIELVDNKLLYWTDSVKPRKINIEKGNITEKKKSWRVYLPKNYTQPFQSWGWNIYAMDGTQLFAGVFTFTSSQNREQAFETIADYINNSATASQYLEAETCGCDLIVTEKQVNQVYFDFAGNSNYQVVAENWYGLNLIDRFFDQAKWQPRCKPIPEYRQDASRKYNFVKSITPRFRISYQYDDFEMSALSPISDIATNNISCSKKTFQSLNSIYVNFNDADLFDSNNFVTIKKVFFYAQSNETSAWREIASYDICDIYSDVEIGASFFGNEQTSVIDNSFASKLYDNNPRKSNSLTVMKNRVMQGGVIEGYNSPDCISAEFNAAFDDDENTEFFTIRGRIRIVNGTLFNGSGLAYANKPRYISIGNGFASGAIFFDENISEFPIFGGMLRDGNDYYINSARSGQRVTDDLSPLEVASTLRQYLPDGGFVPYSAGTPFFSISKQRTLGKGLSQSANGVIDITQEGAGAYAADTFKTITDNYSEFEIKVPKGLHVIRLASHWCSYGDKAKKGTIYDLNNGLAFQRTSTNVVGVRDANGTYSPAAEIVVDVQSDIFIGDFYVQDLVSTVFTLPQGSTYAYDSAVTGYLWDNEGKTDVTSLQQGVPVELAAVFNLSLNVANASSGGSVILQGLNGRMKPNPYPSNMRNATTDHNGYFFYNCNSIIEQTPAQFAAGFLANQERFTAYAATKGLFDGDYLVLRNESGTTLYGCSNAADGESALQTLLNGTATSVADYQPVKYTVGLPPKNTFHGGYYYFDVILAVTEPTARSICSTVIQGEVQDQDGNAIDGVSVIYTQGSVASTNNNGAYAMVAWSSIFETYSPFWRQRNFDRLIFGSGGLCFYEYAQQQQNVSIVQFAQNTTQTPPPYSPTARFDADLAIADITQFILKQAPKRGGVYDIAIRFYDRHGRHCSVVPISALSIPYFSEDVSLYFPSYTPNTYLFGRPIISFDLTNSEKPPIWAATYQFLRTKYRQTYLQWCCNTVTYLARTQYDDGNVVLAEQPTGYGSFNATHIKISLTNIVDYFRNNNTSQITYEFQQGDRVRLIKNRDSVYFEGNIFELEVANYEQSTQSIILVNDLSIPEIQSGDLIEITTTEKVLEGDEKVYYEFGDVYKCTNPDHTNNDYSVITDTFFSWDTYWRPRLIPIFDDSTKYFANILTIIESNSVSDFYASAADNVGRIGIVDEKQKEIYYETKLIASNQILYGTSINGLSSYEAANATEISVSYGALQRIMPIRNVLICITERKVVAVYVGQQIVSDAEQAEVLLNVSQQLFGNDRPLQQDWGTQHPESVCVWNGYVYGADQRMQTIWRYANDGLNAISDYKAKSLIRDELQGRTDIISQFDEYNQEAVFTFLGGKPARTFAYCEPKNRWTTAYSFTPEMYGSYSNQIVSFVSGRLWAHDKNTLYNNFYGVQSQSELWYVINKDNILPKVWQAMFLEILSAANNNGWELYDISNDNGQLSRIGKSNFVKKEAYWHSSFKRDLNTQGVTNPIINGRAMRSNMLVVKMRNANDGLETLKGIVTSYQVSERITF